MADEFSNLVVTGGTGYVGRHFLYWLARCNAQFHVTVVLRGNSLQAAQTRLQRTLTDVAKSYGVPFDSQWLARHCSAILGDITQPMCGVSQADIETLRSRGSAAFWHLAASLNFEESRQDEIERHNINGTAAAVELAQASNCTHFFYVSTAYTCGLAEGEIPERLHNLQGPFGNAYERSKCAAEHLLTARCSAINLPCSIVRPSIVVGVSGTWDAAGGETGLFGFAREVLRAKRRIDSHPGPIRIAGDDQAQVNLVPVDYVAQQMVQLTRESRTFNRVVHLVSGGGPTTKQAVDAITETIGVRNFQFVSALPPDASPLERVLAKRLVFYQTYLEHSKQFATARGAAPPLTSCDVKQLTRSYLEERKADRFALVERTLISRDGIPIVVARNDRAPNPQKETVVIVNALGMPSAALERLTAALTRTHDVLTWESRGSSPNDLALDHKTARFAVHTDDLEDIVSKYRIERFHLIGWCTGADVCMDYLTRHSERVLSVTYLNGAFVNVCDVRTPFQRDLVEIVRRVSRDARCAQLYHTLMTNSATLRAEQGILDSSTSIRSTMSGVDGNLAHLTGAPLQSVELLQRYCLLLQHYFEEAPSSVPACAVPAFFGTAKDDEIAPFEASVKVAAQFKQSRVHFSARGGHFAPCTEDSVVGEIAKFLLSHSANGGPSTSELAQA